MVAPIELGENVLRGGKAYRVTKMTADITCIEDGNVRDEANVDLAELTSITRARPYGPEVGDRLPNGSILLAKSDASARDGWMIVLAITPEAGYQPFATWSCDRLGVTSWGHYFSDLGEALENFKQRALLA